MTRELFLRYEMSFLISEGFETAKIENVNEANEKFPGQKVG